MSDTVIHHKYGEVELGELPEEVQEAVERARDAMEKAEEILDGLVGDLTVAEILMQADCKGRREKSHDCPVYHYLMQKSLSDSGVRIEVDGYSIEFHAGITTLHLDVPHPVSMFIQDFDAGKYPELEREV